MTESSEFELPSINEVADDALHFGEAVGHLPEAIADGSIAGAVTNAAVGTFQADLANVAQDSAALGSASGPLEAAAASMNLQADTAALMNDYEVLSDMEIVGTPQTSMHLPDEGAGGGSASAATIGGPDAAPVAVSDQPEFYGDDGAAGGSGTISTTVYPDGSSVSSVDGGAPVFTPAGTYDDAGVTTVNPDGSVTTTYADGASATISDATGVFAGDAPAEDVGIGGYQLDITPLTDAVGEANEIAQELIDSGVPIGAAVGVAEALADGDYEGAVEEVAIGAVDVGAEALGLPEIDAGVGVLTDLATGNTGAIVGDAETAAIETAAGLAGATLGSVIGPAGTLIGGEIGGLVGGAVAPSAEAAVSDGIDTVENVGSDTISALNDAADDFGDGDIVGGVGDVVGGAVNDVGDVAAGAAEIAGDALEGVGDAVETVVELPGDIVDGVEEAATTVEEGVADVIDDIGDLL